jgi:predicted RNA-binding protein with PUA-like domain
VNVFLFKTEPEEFAYGDLVRLGRCTWDGVSNAQALIHLRSCRAGDEVLVYHTGDEKAVVGLARALGDPYEDPANPGRTPSGSPKFAVVDLGPVAGAPTPLTLAALKGDARFKDFPLVTQPRLSVMPVPASVDRLIRRAAGLPERGRG